MSPFHSSPALSFLILIVCHLVVQSNSWLGILSNERGELNPRDSFVFPGETLKFHCHLKDTTINITDVYLKATCCAGKVNWIVPSNVTTIVDNDLYADILIDENHPTTTTYACRANRIIDSTFVYVERPIVNITNLRGVYNYNSFLEFTWDLGQKYQDDRTKIDVAYNPILPEFINGSACDQQTNVSCRIEKVQAPFLYFRVTVSNSRPRPTYEGFEPLFETSATSLHRFSLLDILKTKAPNNVSIEKTTSTCLSVLWKDPPYVEVSYQTVNQTFYLIEFKAIPDSNDVDVPTVVEEGHRPAPNPKKAVEVCSLNPNTLYQVRVKVKVREINLWSEPGITQGRTDEASELNLLRALRRKIWS